MGWLKGETVRLYAKGADGEDEHGDPVETWTPTDVGNVLVHQVQAGELDDPVRPDGIRAEYKLAFPKEFTATLTAGALRGQKVVLVSRGCGEGDALFISGAPDREIPCPTEWDMTVYAGRTDG